MKPEQRLLYLKIGAVGMVAFCVVYYMMILPGIDSWNAQGDRITALRAEVTDGQTKIDREANLRQRWADMMHANLPEEVSASENAAFKAVGRWARDAGITFTSLTPNWQSHDEDPVAASKQKGPKVDLSYNTLECRMAANGDQVSIGRFLYEMETEPIPVRLEECEITTRDAHGAQLMLTAHFSFLRLPEPPKENGK